MIPEHERVHAALHKLWTIAKDHPDYNKRDWTELDVAIQGLVDLAKKAKHADINQQQNDLHVQSRRTG